jgi:putative ABC transport system permease protein
MTRLVRRKRHSVVVGSLLLLIFLGMGAVISMMSRTTFRPLPFADPGSLVEYIQVRDGMPDPWELDTLTRTTRLVPEISKLTARLSEAPTVSVTFGANTKSGTVIVTLPNYFTTLGLRTDRPSAPMLYEMTRDVAIISRSLARGLGLPKGGESGSQIRVNGRSLTVAGVLEREDAFPLGGDVWYADPGRRGIVWMATARTSGPADVSRLADRLSLAFATVRVKGRSRVSVQSLPQVARPTMTAEQRSLSAGIVIFAIIAILNYGLLGVGEARRRLQEFGIRIAVGATRRQIALQIFMEQLGLIVVALGAATGLFVIATVLAPEDSAFALPRHVPIAIWLMVAGTLALLVAAAALPIGVAREAGELEVLRRVNARGSRFEQVWNRGFIGAQFAVTAFLLVAGGIAAVTLARSKRTSYGYDPADKLVANIAFKAPALQDKEAATRASFQIVDNLRRMLPAYRATIWRRAWRSMPRPGQVPSGIDPDIPGRLGTIRFFAWMSQDIDEQFFDVLGVPIIAGRAFRPEDNASSEPVIILSETTAKQLWGIRESIGKRVRFGEDDAAWRLVVGVAGDAFAVEGTSFYRQAAKAKWGRGIAYRPLRQMGAYGGGFRCENGVCFGGDAGISILIQGSKPERAIPQLRTVVEQATPREAFTFLGPLASFLDDRGEIARGTYTTNLLIGFSFGGFLLAILGAIVLIDEIVRTRTSEIGIRRALGAQSAELVLLASRETFAAGVAGVVAGSLVGLKFGPVVATWMKANSFSRMLPPPTISYSLTMATVLTLITLLAIGTAARALRAARLDPAVALRIE